MRLCYFFVGKEFEEIVSLQSLPRAAIDRIQRKTKLTNEKTLYTEEKVWFSTDSVKMLSLRKKYINAFALITR